MRIAVIGATGVLGRSVVPLLLARGHRVHALVRNPKAASLADHRDLEVFPADILERDTLKAGVTGCAAVMHLATAIPASGGQPDWSRNTAIRTTGTRNLLQVATASKVRRYVQQSVTMAYAGAGAEWITEDAPLDGSPSPVTGPVREMEEQVRNSALDWIIMRGGMFYGPGTARMFAWNELAMAGQLAVPADGSDYLSLVHVDDMASALVLAAEAPDGHSTLNIVDDEPVTYRELFGFIAAIHAMAPPAAGAARLFPSQRVSNRLARQRLGWVPRYPSYRAGWIKGPRPAGENQPSDRERGCQT